MHRHRTVDIPFVDHQPDALRKGLAHVDPLPYGLCEIEPGPLHVDGNVPPSPRRFRDQKVLGNPATGVYPAHADRKPKSCRLRILRLAQKLTTRFVDAYNGIREMIGPCRHRASLRYG